LGKRVRLIFGTCLHIRDKELLVGMANYFYDLEPKLSNLIDNNLLPSRIMPDKYIYTSEAKENSLLQIKNYFLIVNKIIPFFNEYPILGVKSLDFADFKKVAELMETKQHLTSDGLSKIIEIVKGMNLDRSLEKK
jgi:LAGLIDADG endonuclease